MVFSSHLLPHIDTSFLSLSGGSGGRSRLGRFVGEWKGDKSREWKGDKGVERG
jgi:hypothetical protein